MITHEILLSIGFKTLLLSVLVVLARGILYCSGIQSASLHRIIWGGVLLTGLIGAVIPVNVPGPPLFYSSAEKAELPAENGPPALSDSSDHGEIVRSPGSLPEMKTTVFSHDNESLVSFFKSLDMAERDESSVRTDPIQAPSESAESVAAFTTAPDRETPWLSCLFGIWLAGIVILAAGRFAHYFRLLTFLRSAEPAAGTYAAEWNRLLERYRLNPRRLPLLLTDRIGPALVRLPRGPAVVVPRDLWFEATDRAREGILKHEIAHYLRWDQPLCVFAALTSIVHWFNPLAWLAVRKFDEATEWCADAFAFGNDTDGDLVFAESMLALYQATPSIVVSRSAFSGGSLSRRVRYLEFVRKHVRESVLKKLAVLSCALLMLLTGIVRLNPVSIRAEENEAAVTEALPEPAEEKQAATAEKDEPDDPENKLDSTVRGRVLDEDGKLPEGVTIYARILKTSRKLHVRRFVDGEIDPAFSGAVSKGGSFIRGPFKTDMEGRYEFRMPKDGQLSVYFRSETHAPAKIETDRRGELEDIVLKTRSAVKPTVRVLSPEGEPVSDIWVVLTPISYEPTLTRCEIAEAGQCTFKPIEPGEYFLSVSRKPITVSAIKEALEVPYAFITKRISIDETSKEFTFQAARSVSVTVRFEDGLNLGDPEIVKKGWVVLPALAEPNAPVTGWSVRWLEGEPLGAGAYRFRVPYDTEIQLESFQDGGEYRYRIGNETESHRLPTVQLSLGKVDKDLVVTLSDLNSPTLTLEAVDAEGKRINEFWAYCVYPDTEKDSKLRKVDGTWRLTGESLGRTIFSLTRPDRTAILYSSSNFTLDPQTGRGTVRRIQPDSRLVVVLFDRQGRQGSLELNLKSGSEENRVVTLGLPSDKSYQVVQSSPQTISGRFVDEQGNPVGNVQARIFSDKPVTQRRNAADRFYQRVTSDPEGRFSAEVPVESEVSIIAIPRDHALSSWIFEKLDDYGDLVLKKGIRPNVYVLDLNDKPQAGVWINLQAYPDEKDIWEKERSLMMYFTEKPTDLKGTTYFPMVPPGKYLLMVNEAMSRRATDQEGAVHYPKQVATITLDSFEVRIKAVKKEGKSLLPDRGRVVDEQGNPVAGARISIAVNKPAQHRKYQGDQLIGHATSGEDGVFTLVNYSDAHLSDEIQQDEKMTVIVYPRDDDENMLAVKAFEAKVGDALDPIVLEEGMRPTLRLLDQDDKPVPDVYLLMSATDVPYWSVSCRKPTDEQGRCIMPAVKPGSCSVRIIDTHSNRKVLETLSCAFLSRNVHWDSDHTEADIKGVPTVSLDIRFSGEKRPPQGKRWGLLNVSLKDRSYWNTPLHESESLGDGRYRVAKVPKGLPLGVNLDLGDDDTAWSYRLSSSEEFLPATRLLELPALDRDEELLLIERKAARARVRFTDQAEKNIEEFYLIGFYPEKPLTYLKFEQVEGGYRIRKEDMEKKLLTSELQFYDFDLPFRFPSQVEFEWNAEQRQGRVLRIQPEEKVVLIAFDPTGRQGSVETTFAEGEQRDLVLITTDP